MAVVLVPGVVVAGEAVVVTLVELVVVEVAVEVGLLVVAVEFDAVLGKDALAGNGTHTPDMQ